MTHLIRMSYIIHSSSAVVVVRRLDIITAHVCSLITNLQNSWGQLNSGDGSINVVIASVAFSRCSAKLDLVLAAVKHVIGEFGVRVDGVVVCLDTVGIVHRKLRIPFGLYGFILEESLLCT